MFHIKNRVIPINTYVIILVIGLFYGRALAADSFEKKPLRLDVIVTTVRGMLSDIYQKDHRLWKQYAMLLSCGEKTQSTQLYKRIDERLGSLELLKPSMKKALEADRTITEDEMTVILQMRRSSVADYILGYQEATANFTKGTHLGMPMCNEIVKDAPAILDNFR